MANPRTATCVFAEDIRVELGNKFSLMGIFAAEIIVAAPAPVVLPKFCIATWLLFDIGDVPTKVTVRVLVPPNRTEILKYEQSSFQFPYEHDELSHGTLRIVNPIINFPLYDEGFIEVMVETERETFRAGRLRIRLNAKPEEVGLPPNVANATVPPS